MEIPPDSTSRSAYIADLRALAENPNFFVKLTEILRRAEGRVSKDLTFCKRGLDVLWEIFGENQLLYGSDWPNSELLASYTETLTIMRQYV